MSDTRRRGRRARSGPRKGKEHNSLFFTEANLENPPEWVMERIEQDVSFEKRDQQDKEATVNAIKKAKSANQSETVRLDLTGEEAVISIQKRPPSDSPLIVTIKSECVEAETGPIKEEIKTEPVEGGVPGIRVALERTQDQRYSVAFTSDCHRRGGDTDDD